MTISTRPPIRPGATMSLVNRQAPRAGGDDPDDQQEPGRNQHHRASEPRAAIDRMSTKPIAATVAIEMRATPARPRIVDRQADHAAISSSQTRPMWRKRTCQRAG